MPILDRFAPPAYLPDLNSISGGPQQWHQAISSWFDVSIGADTPSVTPGPFQFFNPARFDPGGACFEQAITWNAFPKELLRLYGRKQALVEADRLWPLAHYFSVLGHHEVDRRKFPELFTHYFRPQNEYCEWRVTRGRRNRIRRVTFTSEPPELYFALFGCRVPDDSAQYQFTGDQQLLQQRYENFVGQRVPRRDLRSPVDIPNPVPQSSRIAIADQYNVNNKWNTTDGIVHLCSPPNSLTAEIQLGADASVLRRNAAGRLLVEPEALICCARYGGPNRNSDPTIGAAVNTGARLGAFLTLKDPVGLYMDHIDLSGWEAPDKKGVGDCIHIVRGVPGMIERLVVEVPGDRDFSVSDITIAGERIAFGGQIAECITVKLIAIAHLVSQPLSNDPIGCQGFCALHPEREPAFSRSFDLGVKLPPGFVEILRDEGTVELTAAVPQVQLRGPGGLKLRRRIP